MSSGSVRRVLMTTDTVGGVWTFTLELTRQLSKRGIQVVLAALGGEPNAGQVAEVHRIPNVCLLTSGYKLEWMEEPWEDVERSGQWLQHLEEEYCPDIVHLNSFGHGALPWRSRVVLTVHSCVLSWWQAVKGEPAPAEWNRYRDAVLDSLETASVVTSPTFAMAQTLEQNYGFPPTRCSSIPNGRNAAEFFSANKEPFVFTAGRLWDEAKNVAAVARVSESLPWPVYAGGQAKHPGGGRAYPHEIRMLGLLGTCEMAGWLSRAAIFTMPARYEPFGLSVLEAGLSGCALVLGDIASLREVWGDAALFVAPDDDEALRKAICSLTGDDRLRTEMALRSLARALTFSSERMAELYLSAYWDLSAYRNSSTYRDSPTYRAAMGSQGVPCIS